MSKARIREILIPYQLGEMHLNNAITLLGGGIIVERILKQLRDGKISFLEAIDQIFDLKNS